LLQVEKVRFLKSPKSYGIKKGADGLLLVWGFSVSVDQAGKNLYSLVGIEEEPAALCVFYENFIPASILDGEGFAVGDANGVSVFE
jgi:hypothetical protein